MALPNDSLPTLREKDPQGLISSCRRGDSQAFEGLYRRHVGRVHAISLRLCGDQGEAEEVTQEAFVRAWRSLAEFRGDCSFATWLHQIAVRAALSHLRGRSRWGRELPLDLELEELPHPTARSGGGDAMDIEAAIAALPLGARAVFVLSELEGWRHREIAKLLEVTTGTTKAQLHRARQLLRGALS